jgi:putative Mg2+ transporter-C (MgtC) family protein
VDVNLQLELGLRLLVAGLLGGIIGVEREIHEHPAGMRTHTLVALGCALFTILSIYGFDITIDGQKAPVDPSRLAAQIVSGIGFLGAGAILKYGTSIRGLTTAASLWATAAIGIAAGTGQYFLAIVGFAIVIFSLWPLGRVAHALRLRNARWFKVRLVLRRLQTLSEIASVLDAKLVVIEGIQTQRSAPDRYEIEIEMRLVASVSQADVITSLDELPDVDVVETTRAVE